MEERPLCSVAVGCNHGQRAGKPEGSVLLLSLCQSYQATSAPGFPYCSLRFSSLRAARQEESVTAVCSPEICLEECRHNNLIPQSQQFLLYHRIAGSLGAHFPRLPGVLRKDPGPSLGVLFFFRCKPVAGGRMAKKIPEFPAGS